MSEQQKHVRDMSPDEYRAARASMIAESHSATCVADSAHETRDVIIKHLRRTIKADRGGS